MGPHPDYARPPTREVPRLLGARSTAERLSFGTRLVSIMLPMYASIGPRSVSTSSATKSWRSTESEHLSQQVRALAQKEVFPERPLR